MPPLPSRVDVLAQVALQLWLLLCLSEAVSPSFQLSGRSSGGSSGDGSGGEQRRQAGGSGRHGGRRRKARVPGLFEVHDISPPPRSLGIHALPPVSRAACSTCEMVAAAASLPPRVSASSRHNRLQHAACCFIPAWACCAHVQPGIRSLLKCPLQSARRPYHERLSSSITVCSSLLQRAPSVSFALFPAAPNTRTGASHACRAQHTQHGQKMGSCRADQLAARFACCPAPQNTHNGDQIEVEGSAFVVQAVVMQYKLVRGKYR